MPGVFGCGCNSSGALLTRVPKDRSIGQSIQTRRFMLLGWTMAACNSPFLEICIKK
jgi:hypothetical protein